MKRKPADPDSGIPDRGTAAGARSPLARQQARLAPYRPGLRWSEQGSVVSIGDGIAWIRGLPSAAMEERLELEDGSRALVFHLAEDRIGAILLEQTPTLASGAAARHGDRHLRIGVGEALLGRVVDPLGLPLDGGQPPDCPQFRELDRLSPPIIERDFVHRPLYTGNRIIDTMLPIGKGQRQLLVGDSGLGKTSLALDTVVNQADKNVVCVYVLIGQKRSTVLRTLETLQAAGAMEYTTVVVADANALPGLQYLAPFAGCTIGEFFLRRGRDALVVYDDLTTHANGYRELSLLLKRPPGREAFPADIFSLHARLLERSTCLASRSGGGSLTALPIIETREGEIASYIPTNLISITDGQVYFDAGLFASGILPAIDIRRSVSRIGGQAQHAAVKREAARMKLDYLHFLELEVFTRLGARLEASMQRRIRRGRALRQILLQERLAPETIEFQLAWMIAFNDGIFDERTPEAITAALARLRAWAATAPSLEAPRSAWQAPIATLLAEGESA